MISDELSWPFCPQTSGEAKFETVALISKEMRISLDAVVFHDEKPREIPKVVADFFAGKSDAEAERYIALCQSAEKLKNGE